MAAKISPHLFCFSPFQRNVSLIRIFFDSCQICYKHTTNTSVATVNFSAADKQEITPNGQHGSQFKVMRDKCVISRSFVKSATSVTDDTYDTYDTTIQPTVASHSYIDKMRQLKHIVEDHHSKST